MDFEHFRSLNGWTLERAAEEFRKNGDPDLAHVNGSVIGQHERGLRAPKTKMIARYAEITDNAVTWADWHRIAEGGVRPPRPRGRRKASQAQAASTG